MAGETTVTVEQIGKELDRQMGKKQRLDDELDVIADQLHAIARRIAQIRREVNDPWR